MSSVERIICYSGKGEKGQVLEQVNLIEDSGMEGDYHAIGGDRQLTLVSKKTKSWMDSQETKGFCFERFHENIVVEGIVLDTLPNHTKLKVGNAMIELSEIRKKCYPKICILNQTGKGCMLMQEGRFAKVLVEGNIKRGDPVLVIR